MFDRFDDRTRGPIDRAQVIAHRRGARRVGVADLLAGVLAVPGDGAVEVLRRLGVPLGGVEADLADAGGGRRPLPDAEALAAVGIDLDEVRQRVEDAFGPGALDRTRAARAASGPARQLPVDRRVKAVLDLAVREARGLGHAHVGCEHLLLGMLHPDTGTVHDVLVGRGVRQASARAVVGELVRERRWVG